MVNKGISILVEKSLSFGNLARFPMLPLFSSGDRGEKHKLNKLMFFFFRTAVVRKLFDISRGGLATAFDLAAFRLSMIAPVKKSVNHPKTVASMRGTGWENNKFVLAAFSQRFGSVK